MERLEYTSMQMGKKDQGRMVAYRRKKGSPGKNKGFENLDKLGYFKNVEKQLVSVLS